MTTGHNPEEGDSLVPSYEGDNLVNLMAELEIRLTGSAPARGLRPDLAGLVPTQTQLYAGCIRRA